MSPHAFADGPRNEDSTQASISGSVNVDALSATSPSKKVAEPPCMVGNMHDIPSSTNKVG